LLAFAVLALPALATASDATATIRIRIVSPASLPTGVTVEFAGSPFSSIAEFPDARRAAIVRALAAGRYRVTVRMAGYRDATATIDLETALEGEAKLQGIAGASADHAEGLAAFREKRAPRFTGQ